MSKRISMLELLQISILSSEGSAQNSLSNEFMTASTSLNSNNAERGATKDVLKTLLVFAKVLDIL